MAAESATEVVERWCDHHRQLVLDELRRFVATYGGDDVDLYDLMLDYPLRPAKALRPSLCVAAARALGGSEASVLSTAAAIELFHNAFLIHDDVEDRSLQRRGAETMQQRVGVATAINVADGMLALALRPLLENTERLGLGPALEVLDVFAQMVQTTVEGQALELAWIRENRVRFPAGRFREAYEDMVIRKTAHYSFIAPVAIGCLAARASGDARQALETYARHLGVAFQITDDLLNITPGLDGYGKEERGDLWEGKRTLILQHALDREGDTIDGTRAAEALRRPRPVDPSAGRARAALQEALDALLSAGRLDQGDRDDVLRLALAAGGHSSVRTTDDVAHLAELIRRHGSVGFARGVATEHAERAAEALDGARPWLAAGDARDFLDALVTYVMDRLW